MTMKKRPDLPDALPAEVVEGAPRIEMSRRAIITGLAAGTVIPIATACSTNPVTGAGQFILPGFDEASLASMAATAWDDMKKQVPQTGNSRLRSRVLNVWERTGKARAQVRGYDYASQNWDIAVFDTDDVNAFVMPGNKVGVYRGLTDLTENDDQLSAVLGHEAGHVDGRHAAERASMQAGTSIALAVGSVAIASSDELQKYGNEIVALGGAAVQFGILLPYSRRHELEADKLGVDYMHAGGYQVRESVRLWELMDQNSAGQRPPEFMSTHPDPGRRAAELVQYINAKGYDLI